MLRPTSSMLRRCSLVAAALAVVAFTPSRAHAQFGSLWFFGDSFTDVGNASGLSALNNLPNPTPPPYLQGRFSNGPVWSENFALRLGMPAAAGPAWLKAGNNYAVGGARTGPLGALGSLTGMQSQALQYGQDQGVADPTGLYVLWGGGNDLTDAVSLASPADRLAAVQTAAANLSQIALGLHQAGARNFLVPLLPNLGAAPEYAGKPMEAAIASSLTNVFNQLLGIGIQQLGFLPGVSAYGLNLDNLLTNIQIDAPGGGQLYGITNTTTPCFLLLQVNPQACNTAAFVDAKHPTEIVGALIADAAYNRVINGQDVAVIPEPATVLLVAGGLALMGVVARRRKSA